MHCEFWCLALPLPYLASLNALSHIEAGAYFASTSNPVGELHLVLLHISQFSLSKQPPYLHITAVP